jgi:dipeptide/tripeptide permease
VTVSTSPPKTSFFEQVKGYDRVFWICIWMELMERMAYYGVRLVVPVYLVLAKTEGGPGLTHVDKGTILAFWAATQSWLPTFSGGFSDRYGYKRTLVAAALLKASGYAVMAMAGDFWMMLLGTQLLATGTGIFKPGIQGTMAHSIVRVPGGGSLGWGLFYQSVNIGAAVSAYIPMFTRDVYGWPSVFWACTLLVLSNLIPLIFYEDPQDERQTEKDQRSLGTLVVESVRELVTSPVLLGFVFISAGFWFLFHQIFDMLPNFVDDWTDSSKLLAFMGRVIGNETWVQEASQGAQIPQERLLNLNAILIMTTMWIFAWLSGKIRVLLSTALGMALATFSLLFLIGGASVWTVLLAIVVFTVGEMLSSPKKQEYMTELAPPGKRALFLGYANMPDGIGWVLGSLVAGNVYEQKGDKVNLARRFLDEHASSDAARGWIDGYAQAAAGKTDERWTEKAIEEATKRAHDELGLSGEAPQVAEALRAIPDAEVTGAVAEVIPRGHVIDFTVANVPTLPDGTATTAATLRDWLFQAYDPGQVWIPFLASGAVSVVLMLVYDRWVRARNRRLKESAAA